jgi:uncharacterized protein YbjT (DUF2867 family)
MKRVLVLGGTGFVGRSVCEALMRQHPACSVRVPTRKRAHGAVIQTLPNVELLQADVHDMAALTRLLQGCDAVVNLVASLHGTKASFEHVHVVLPRKLAQACRQAGVTRLVHISALGVSAQAPSLYLRSKAQGEAVFRGAPELRSTVLRPSVIFGANDQFLRLFARLQSLAPVLPLAGSGALFQPVWVEDVAQGVVQALNAPATAGQVYECTGPEVFTLSELVRLAGRYSGHERPQLPLPNWAGQLQAWAMECLPGQPLMSRDNIASMQVPSVATAGAAGLSALGLTPSSLHAVAPQYLSAQYSGGRFERWRARHGRG